MRYPKTSQSKAADSSPTRDNGADRLQKLGLEMLKDGLALADGTPSA